MPATQSLPAAPVPAAAPIQLPAGPDIAGLLDVSCPVEVVLGTGSMSVRACLALVPNTVVRLVEAAGDDVQVVVGSVPLARAEVVVDDDRAAIRITEVLPARVGEAAE
jgi:flagellar motor switch protein FliN/FliY